VNEATTEAGKLLGKLCEVFYASDREHPSERNTAPSQAGETKSTGGARQ
jgi:hypothetical protein